MENVFDAVDHLRNRLGVLYWTLKHNGDREKAAAQLRDAMAFAEQIEQPSDASTLLLRWQCQQLRSLLGTAGQTLERLGLTARGERQERKRPAAVAF